MKESCFIIVPNDLRETNPNRAEYLANLADQEEALGKAADGMTETGYAVAAILTIPPHGDFLLHGVMETDDER